MTKIRIGYFTLKSIFPFHIFIDLVLIPLCEFVLQ